MKCASCGISQKYSEGLVCKQCGYKNVIDPKEPPRITDNFIKNCIQKVSRNGEFYYTYEQLLAQFAIHFSKKYFEGWIVFYIIGFVLLCMVFINFFFWLFGIFMALAIMIVVYLFFSTKNKRYDYELLNTTLRKYLNTYPDKNLVDGRAFSDTKQEIEEELSDYSPESILIVDKNDYVDMLILNRYHIENKVLVVSKSKYPYYIFEYLQKLFQKHPNIPIRILHEASMEGESMKNKLLDDESWNLQGREIQDLGLFWSDTRKLKKSIFFPNNSNENIQMGKKIPYQANIRIPLGMLPPVVLGSVLLGTMSGSGLSLADSIEEHQKNSLSGSSDFG